MAKKTPPKSEAIPLGTKKKTAPKLKPKPKKAAQPRNIEPEGELHAREPKPSEEELITKRRRFVAAYLVARDGMDEGTAAMVVDGLEPEELGDLWEEASASGAPDTSQETAESIAAAAAEANAPEPEIPEFTDFEGLASSEDFPGLVLECVEQAGIKNKAEKEYKEKKTKLIELVKSAGVERDHPFTAFGIKLERYQGSSPKQLDPQRLLEKGVSIDVINACYKSTKYDDIRFTVPKP
jgi:hypothetical protein